MKLLRMRRRRSGRALAVPGVVGVALLALSGCAQSPGVAARVNGAAISTQDVQLMTQALCSERFAARKQGLQKTGFTMASVAQVRSQALQALIESQINQQWAHKKHLPANGFAVAQQMQSLGPLLKRLPAEDRARTRNLISMLFRGETQLQKAGADYLDSQGQAANPQTAQQAGIAQRQPFVKATTVTVNPRYNTQGTGHTKNAQSLSKPVSDFAHNAASAKPSEQWVVDLPANQRCG